MGLPSRTPLTVEFPGVRLGEPSVTEEIPGVLRGEPPVTEEFPEVRQEPHSSIKQEFPPFTSCTINYLLKSNYFYISIPINDFEAD